MSTYRTSLICFPVSSMPGRKRDDIENGGKILLPPSVLESLSRLNISYPLLFKISNPLINKTTHCGVLEFLADEGTLVAPSWILEHLDVSDGDSVRVETTSLPTAIYSRFQPQSVDFLDISDPKAVLENTLRHFSCLTTGDIFALNYNKRIYKLKVEETRPGNAVVIIECDMSVDFSPPEGYVEPSKQDEDKNILPINKKISGEWPMSETSTSFHGMGKRLDGKRQKLDSCENTINDNDLVTSEEANENFQNRRGIPDFDYEVGQIKFFRDLDSPNTNFKSGCTPKPSSSKKEEDKENKRNFSN